MTSPTSINQLIAEFRSKPRLRWGVWAIVGVLWLYGVLELRDLVRVRHDAYVSLNKKVARIQGTLAQEEWQSRLEETRSMQLDLESRLWKENTLGLAQATFHDWLNQTLQQGNIAKAQVAVAAHEEDGKPEKDGDGAGADSASWKVTAKLAFDFYPQSFYPLLAKLAGNERRVVVESLAIRGAPAPRAELVLVAYFRKPMADEASEVAAEKAR